MISVGLGTGHAYSLPLAGLTGNITPGYQAPRNGRGKFYPRISTWGCRAMISQPSRGINESLKVRTTKKTSTIVVYLPSMIGKRRLCDTTRSRVPQLTRSSHSRGLPGARHRQTFTRISSIEVYTTITAVPSFIYRVFAESCIHRVRRKYWTGN